MTTPPRRRAGFTLIELLMVIAIIMILATATFGIYRGVSNSRMKARGRGEIQRLIIGCENFKKTYGD
ncbi:MAG: prepilin-type N-terminal cleavage/methylation domain-containing protein, partial [Verrucomicrobia bacterium]|nr:prepilin-type N-terminal cleavage/methylation domain-containing protein [Verrucomicrobiota bacterium]